MTSTPPEAPPSPDSSARELRDRTEPLVASWQARRSFGERADGVLPICLAQARKRGGRL